MHVQKSTAFNYIIHSYKVINAMEFMIINDDLFDLSADNRTHTFPLVINRKGGQGWCWWCWQLRELRPFILIGY